MFKTVRALKFTAPFWRENVATILDFNGLLNKVTTEEQQDEDLPCGICQIAKIAIQRITVEVVGCDVHYNKKVCWF
jgi:hypothetical protein